MKTVVKMMCCLLTFAIMGCQTIATVPKPAEPLVLVLAVEKATTQKLNLVATLTNTSKQDLALKVPKNQHPLTVLVWITDGHNLSHRISRRLVSDHKTTEYTDIEAGGSVVIHAEVDLTKYKDRIRPNEQLFVSAQYGLDHKQLANNLPSLIYSNKVYLE